MAQPTKKVSPKPGFDPRRTRPMPDNPEFGVDAELEDSATQMRDQQIDRQRYKPPMQRTQPVFSFEHGGAVKFGSATRVKCGGK